MQECLTGGWAQLNMSAAPAASIGSNSGSDLKSEAVFQVRGSHYCLILPMFVLTPIVGCLLRQTIFN